MGLVASLNDLMHRFYEKFFKSGDRLPVDVGGQITVDEINIGEVKQGARGENAEPWQVTLTGQLAQLTPSQTMASVAADTWVTLFDFELTPAITSVYPYVFVVVDSSSSSFPMTFRIVRSGWWTTGGGYTNSVNIEEFFTTSKLGISPTIPVKAVRATIQVRLNGGSKSIRPVIMGSKHYLDFNYAGVSE